MDIPITVDDVAARADDRPPAEADEHALIRRALAEPAEFATLYRRHYDAMAGYLFRRTGDRHATEELLSELFVAAWRGLARFEPRGVPFRGWLYGIATRLVNRHVRRRRVRPEPLDPDANLADPRPAAPARAETSDEAARVLRALLQLAPKHQTVIALHYMEGLAIEEIAAALGVRPGTVKSRLDRARRRLKKRLTARR